MRIKLEFRAVKMGPPCREEIEKKPQGVQTLNIGLISLTYGIYHTRYPTIKEADWPIKLLGYSKAFLDSISLAYSLRQLSQDRKVYPEYLEDFETRAFWGRIGAAFGYLALAKGGYTFIGPAISLLPNKSRNCSIRQSHGRRPDFVLENANRELAVLETKGNSILREPSKYPPSSEDIKSLREQVLPYYGGELSPPRAGGKIAHAWYSRLFKRNDTPTVLLAHTPNAPWGTSSRSASYLRSWLSRIHYDKVLSLIGLPILGTSLLADTLDEDIVDYIDQFLNDGWVLSVTFKGKRFYFSPLTASLLPPFSSPFYPRDWWYWRYWWYWRDWRDWWYWWRWRKSTRDFLPPLFALEEGYFKAFLRGAIQLTKVGKPGEVWEKVELPLLEIPYEDEIGYEGDDPLMFNLERQPVLFRDGILGFIPNHFLEEVEPVRVLDLLG